MGNVINEEQKGGREVGERRDDVINEASVALDVAPGSRNPTPVPERPHFINLEDATDPEQMEIRKQAKGLSTKDGVSKESDRGVSGFIKSSASTAGEAVLGREGARTSDGRPDPRGASASPAPRLPASSPGSTSRRWPLPVLESPGVVTSVGDISEPVPSNARSDAGGAGDERPAGGEGGRWPGLV